MTFLNPNKKHPSASMPRQKHYFYIVSDQLQHRPTPLTKMHLHHIFCLPSMINAPLNPAWILVGADYQWDSVLKEPYGQLFGPAFLIC